MIESYISVQGISQKMPTFAPLFARMFIIFNSRRSEAKER